MKKTFFLVYLITVGAFLSTALTGCATHPLKAPCGEYAVFCGQKTKINQN